MKIRSQKDFWAGLMFIAFGILAIVVSRNYPMGTAFRLGPGYFSTYPTGGRGAGATLMAPSARVYAKEACT